MKIGMLTSGGDCQGLNSALRGVAKALYYRFGKDVEIYGIRDGARDYWEIGGALGAGVIEAKVALHPIDILDAFLGFFLIDIKGDDLTFENFK